jgi:HSP20 family protein
MDFSLFPRDLIAEVERLQRQVQQAFDVSPSIRGLARGGYPALNVAGTPDSVEIYAFAPGLVADAIEVQLERGVLSLSGTRQSELSPRDAAATSVHQQERFSGRFHRVVTLADDLDPDQVRASYRDGVLHVSIGRKEESKRRRINVT